jgi:hypothetical protein
MGHPLILDADDHRVGDRAFRDEADDVNGARSVDPGEDDCRALSIGGRMPEKDSIVLKNPTAGGLGVLPMATGVKVDEARGASRGHDWRREGDELGQFPQVLGGGGEEELVAGAGGAT